MKRTIRIKNETLVIQNIEFARHNGGFKLILTQGTVVKSPFMDFTATDYDRDIIESRDNVGRITGEVCGDTIAVNFNGLFSKFNPDTIRRAVHRGIGLNYSPEIAVYLPITEGTALAVSETGSKIVPVKDAGVIRFYAEDGRTTVGSLKQGVVYFSTQKLDADNVTRGGHALFTGNTAAAVRKQLSRESDRTQPEIDLGTARFVAVYKPGLAGGDWDGQSLIRRPGMVGYSLHGRDCGGMVKDMPLCMSNQMMADVIRHLSKNGVSYVNLRKHTENLFDIIRGINDDLVILGWEDITDKAVDLVDRLVDFNAFKAPFDYSRGWNIAATEIFRDRHSNTVALGLQFAAKLLAMDFVLGRAYIQKKIAEWGISRLDVGDILPQELDETDLLNRFEFDRNLAALNRELVNQMPYMKKSGIVARMNDAKAKIGRLDIPVPGVSGVLVSDLGAVFGDPVLGINEVVIKDAPLGRYVFIKSPSMGLDEYIIVDNIGVDEYVRRLPDAEDFVSAMGNELVIVSSSEWARKLAAGFDYDTDHGRFILIDDELNAIIGFRQGIIVDIQVPTVTGSGESVSWDDAAFVDDFFRYASLRNPSIGEITNFFVPFQRWAVTGDTSAFSNFVSSYLGFGSGLYISPILTDVESGFVRRIVSEAVVDAVWNRIKNMAPTEMNLKLALNDVCVISRYYQELGIDAGKNFYKISLPIAPKEVSRFRKEFGESLFSCDIEFSYYRGLKVAIEDDFSIDLYQPALDQINVEYKAALELIDTMPLTFGMEIMNKCVNAYTKLSPTYRSALNTIARLTGSARAGFKYMDRFSFDTIMGASENTVRLLLGRLSMADRVRAIFGAWYVDGIELYRSVGRYMLEELYYFFDEEFGMLHFGVVSGSVSAGVLIGMPVSGDIEEVEIGSRISFDMKNDGRIMSSKDKLWGRILSLREWEVLYSRRVAFKRYTRDFIILREA
jgi:hypothetical protein